MQSFANSGTLDSTQIQSGTLNNTHRHSGTLWHTRTYSDTLGQNQIHSDTLKHTEALLGTLGNTRAHSNTLRKIQPNSGIHAHTCTGSGKFKYIGIFPQYPHTSGNIWARSQKVERTPTHSGIPVNAHIQPLGTLTHTLAHSNTLRHS